MWRKLPIIAIVTVALAWPQRAGQAQPPVPLPPPVRPGEKMLYKETLVARNNGQVVDHRQWELPFVVHDVRGPFVQVGEGEKVWVERTSLLTLDEAPPYYTVLIDRWRGDERQTWAYSMRAIARIERRELDQAIADFGEVLRVRPLGSMYVNRARAFNLKQEYDRALEDLNVAMERGVRNYVVYLNRGDAWRGKGDFDKAIADYSESIRLNPKAAMAYCGRALAWRGKGDLDKAIADYDEAVRSDPRPFAYVMRGHVWRAKKEYDRALADFRKAFEIGPNDAFAANGLAWFLATCPSPAHRDGKRAVELALAACELNGLNNANSLDTLAAAYAEAGDFANAAKSEQKCLELSANDSDLKKGATERLALYQAKKPYRTD